MTLSYSVWHALPLAARVKIATTFGVSKTGPTHVVNNRVESDGYRFEEIESAISVAALQNYTGSTETDFVTLWNLMADKLEGREPAELHPHTVVDENEETIEIQGKGHFDTKTSEPVTDEVSVVKKRGRKPKVK